MPGTMKMRSPPTRCGIAFPVAFQRPRGVKVKNEEEKQKTGGNHI